MTNAGVLLLKRVRPPMSGTHSLPRCVLFWNYLLAMTLLIIIGADVRAQDGADSYPPPAKVIPKEEKRRLESETDVKKRTRFALELMEFRLKNAESRHEQESWDAMFVELGIFHALVDDTFVFLNAGGQSRDKVLNNLKRYEIGLRLFGPRIEVLRRGAPPEYEYYLRTLAIHVRRTRAKAVEPLFDDTVVPLNRSRVN